MSCEHQLYKNLSGRKEQLTTNTAAATYKKYNPNDRVSFVLGFKNNANMTVMGAINVLKAQSQKIYNKPEYYTGPLLNNRQMKTLFITILILPFSLSAVCQDLRRIPLTRDDSIQGVFLRYSYEASGSYGVVSLVLKKGKTYLYRKSSFSVEGVSEGKWELSNNLIKLKSTLQEDNIPVKINYGTKGDFVDSLNIAVVKNIKNEPLTDAFVFVNSDTIKCLPLTGQCNGSFKTIKKVKVVFENGLSSKWICVKEGETKILLTVLSDMPVRTYVVMNNMRFKIDGDFLKEK